MMISVVAVMAGLALLVWSADKFIDGASATARYLGMSPLMIGILIVGFGTSAPEMIVSVMAAIDGSPSLALGNAYGSNIANMGLILGATAIMSPIVVQSKIIRREMPLLIFVTLASFVMISNGMISKLDAGIMLGLLMGAISWAVFTSRSTSTEQSQLESGDELGVKIGIAWLIVGLILLVVSSRLLVWGAVNIAGVFGVSDLIIGLTVVAIGTSLPELAASIAAVKKNEHQMAIGNIIGSNLFNSLGVVGLAGIIHPFVVEKEVMYRDYTVMGLLTLVVFLMGIGLRGGNGRINRVEGAGLLACFLLYNGYLMSKVIN